MYKMAVNPYDINRNLNGTFKKGHKIPAYWKGKKRSEEIKKLWSEQRKGKGNSFYGRHHTDETKEKLRKKSIEIHQNPEIHKKYIDALRKWHKEHPDFTRGENNGFYGKHHKEGFNIGESNGMWNGGSSKEPYPFGFDDTLKEFVRKRDLYTCQLCNRTEKDLDSIFSVHHIDYVKKNIDLKNLITLCQSCHGKTNFNREDWTKYLVKNTK